MSTTDGVEPIYRYTAEQATEDGLLVDLTEWASPENGIMGGILGDGKRYTVKITHSLWNLVQAPKGSTQDTRGRAHDVLWMGGLALRSALKRNDSLATNAVAKIGNKNVRFWVKLDANDLITLLLPDDY